MRANRKYPLVVKADGLALGKGVLICEDEAAALAAVKSIMEDRQFGASGSRIVIEEFLTGPEVSVPTAKLSCPWCPAWTTSARWTATGA